MGKIIRLALADDHKVIRDSINLLVEARAKNEMEIIIDVNDGDLLIDQLKKKKADVLILDLQMPGVYAEQTVRFLKKKFPELKIIILTFHREWDKAAPLIKAGAMGFITKNFGLEEVIDGIRAVMKGEIYTRNIEYEFELTEEDKKLKAARIKGLNKQNKLLLLLAKGKQNSEIARSLGLDIKTIESRKRRLFQLTGTRNSNELIAFAMRYGLIK